MRTIPTDKIDSIISMHAAGASKSKISRDLKLNPTTVRKYLKKYTGKLVIDLPKSGKHFSRIRKLKAVRVKRAKKARAGLKSPEQALQFIKYVCALHDVDTATKVSFIKKALGV